MAKLIINADDFGLNDAINNGVIDAFNQGCLTSTSLIANGPAFEQALILIANNPGLGVGVHLTLVAEKPVCNPGAVPSLVDKEGRLFPRYQDFLSRYVRGKINKADIRRELTAQIEKVVKQGIKVSHLDSHQHLHVFPGIIDIVLALAKKFGIAALRIPDEPFLFFGGVPFSPFRTVARNGLTFLAGFARRKANNQGLAIPDNFFGMLAGGNMQEAYLVNIIKRLPPGTTEIMVHPGLDNLLLQSTYGWNYHWQEELKAITSKRLQRQLRERKITLINFRELIHG